MLKLINNLSTILQPLLPPRFSLVDCRIAYVPNFCIRSKKDIFLQNLKVFACLICCLERQNVFYDKIHSKKRFNFPNNKLGKQRLWDFVKKCLFLTEFKNLARKLYVSLPTRIAAVIAAEGCWTDYWLIWAFILNLLCLFL